jgi:Asp-tRNA(Asn)/Glu-tRNA(Gln) amidotransferase A subunit family amidase
MLLNSASLATTVADLRAGRLDLHQSIDRQCDLIDRIDGRIASLLPEDNRRERLHREAAALLAADPLRTSPLFGALVGVKDIFHVDGFVTRAGTMVPPELFAGPEAAVAGRLKAAGALILGKTVTTEFAYFEPGPTRNPHHLDHTPGGSSSGSAAAVAAGLAPLAVGTQTIGSVNRPASFCGVVGFKPTHERIPSQGMVYFSRTVDHVGLFTQSVDDMTLAASALCDDWMALELAEDDLPVLGIPDGPYLRQAGAEMQSMVRKMSRKLEAAGYTIFHVPTLLDIEEINQWHRRMVIAEFSREHAHLYPGRQALYRPRTVEIIELGRLVSDGELAELQGRCLELREELDQQMEQAGIDLWMMPAALGPAPEGIGATGDPAMNLPWTTVGFPSLTLPAAKAVNGLPLGVQLVANYEEDELLLAWATEIADYSADD